jgi:hypothetical protein
MLCKRIEKNGEIVFAQTATEYTLSVQRATFTVTLLYNRLGTKKIVGPEKLLPVFF